MQTTRQRVQTLFQGALGGSWGAPLGSAIAGAWGEIGSPRTWETVYEGVESHTPGAARIGPETFFDLASLTKLVATTSLAMVAVDKKILPWPGLGPNDGSSSLNEWLRDLSPEWDWLRELTHTTGLPAWAPLYEQLQAQWGAQLLDVPLEIRREEFFRRAQKIFAAGPVTPPGSQVLYSDLGFLRFQSRFGTGFSDLIQTAIWNQIPDSKFHYRPVVRPEQTLGYVATELCPWRGLMQGQVHDDNTWSMGGIAAHAGVFGRLQDVVQWLHSLWQDTWVSQETVRRFTATAQPDPAGVMRSVGWDRPSLDGLSSVGSLLGSGTPFGFQTIGHLGFVGTSVWLNLDTGFFAVLLTNRVHPSRTDQRIRAFRRAFHQQLDRTP